ncbi:MAG: M23 family metallopeptidase [Deltaproteobacteria bacterium]|nr:M23 family metallopeptidase [Deltaproteobacteria bacterium]
MTTAKKIILLSTALSLFAFFSIFVFTRQNIPASSAETAAASAPPATVSNEDADRNQNKSTILVEGELQSGDTLSKSLTKYNIEPVVRQQILENLADCLDFRKLRPKDKFRVFLDDQGQLLRCEYENGPLESYSVTRTAGTFVAQKDQVNVVIKTCMVEDSISSSLFDAFFNNQLRAPLVYAFADIFSSRLDFNTETQKEDTFQIVFEKYFKDDQFVGYGNILYARYQQQDGKIHEGYFYQPDEASTGAYFDAQGTELGTSFIKSPVPLGRVTSKFSFSRLHPVSGIMRPHLGVDLAAPSGTPIMATSDGKVSYVGFNGGFGRQIVISHAGGYQTFYGHLSRFSKGLKTGSVVKQKQIIGYVGSSGISTGPHLDYRVQQLGKFYDPFAIEFQPKSVLRGEKLARFQNNITVLSSLLESTSDPETLYVRYMVLKPDEQLTML